MKDQTYLPMDCPNCGRMRLEVFYDSEAKSKFRIECEKCGATGFDCDEKEHQAGGVHRQWADRFAGWADTQSGHHE